MMALLFAIWAGVFALAWAGRRREAIFAGLFALVLCVAMFRHHITDTIDIDL